MKRLFEFAQRIDNKLRKHSFYLPLLTGLNIIIFIYLLVLVTHPSIEVINITTSILSVVITCVGFYLVYVNLKSIDESNKVNRSTQKYDYYLKRIDELAKESETYSFSNYHFHTLINKESPKGLLNLYPVFNLYITELTNNALYKSDTQRLTEVYYEEQIIQRPYKKLIDDLIRLRKDIIENIQKGYFLIIEIHTRKDILEDSKEFLYAEIIRLVMKDYINICYDYSFYNNPAFPDKARKEKTGIYFNGYFYDIFFALVTSKKIQDIIFHNLYILIESQRLKAIKEKYNMVKGPTRTRFKYLPE